LLPPSETLQVTASDNVVTVKMRSEGTWREAVFYGRPGSWKANEPAAFPVFATQEVRWMLLFPDFVSRASVPGRVLEQEAWSATVDDSAASADPLVGDCAGALALIAGHAEMYVPWVGYVIRDLIPLPARSGTLQSWSEDSAPGIITVSLGGIPSDQRDCAMAETLVHEATHQYFYILRRLGQFDDGTDRNLYFSPFKDTGRPITNILLAYHAFANVALFYRTVLADQSFSKQATAPAAARRLETLEQQLLPLESTLQRAVSITPLGRSLWEPLYDRLHH
jgi:HEXXH motif-containing protein